MRRQWVVCVQLPVGQADHLHQGQITCFKNTFGWREKKKKKGWGELLRFKDKTGTTSKKDSLNSVIWFSSLWFCQTQNDKNNHTQRTEVAASACGYFDTKTWGTTTQSRIKAVSFLSSHHFNMRSSGRSPKACLVQTECLLQTGTNPCDL